MNKNVIKKKLNKITPLCSEGLGRALTSFLRILLASRVADMSSRGLLTGGSFLLPAGAPPPGDRSRNSANRTPVAAFRSHTWTFSSRVRAMSAPLGGVRPAGRCGLNVSCELTEDDEVKPATPRGLYDRKRKFFYFNILNNPCWYYGLLSLVFMFFYLQKERLPGHTKNKNVCAKPAQCLIVNSRYYMLFCSI